MWGKQVWGCVGRYCVLQHYTIVSLLGTEAKTEITHWTSEKLRIGYEAAQVPDAAIWELFSAAINECGMVLNTQADSYLT